MYNWLVRRVLERTSAPQAVYPAVVDAGVRLWMPAIALAAASFVTPMRAKMDVRYEVQPPVSSWIQQTLPTGPTTAQIWPAIESGTQRSFRTADRAKLDVRSYRWDSDFGVDDSTTTSVWTPVNNPVSFVTPKRAQFDVRSYDWSPSQAWIFTNLPPAITQAQIWPAVSQGTQNNYRTADRARLDVRGYEWRSDAPFLRPATAQIPSFAPIFSGELASYRTNDRARLDVRAYDWAPEPAWITTVQTPPVTTAQTWPAILDKGGSYSTPKRFQFDVRGYDWSPAFSWVTAPATANVPKWAPAFAAELASFRTIARAPLDVRRYDWLPAFTWDFPLVPVGHPRIITAVASRSNAITAVASRSNAITAIASKT